MSAEGVSALRGCDVLVEDFATTCPDQKKWLMRYAGGCRVDNMRQKPTLAYTLRSVGYSGRPEYFTMFACVYNMMRCSPQWLQDHAEELRQVRQLFQKEHGFECAPAAAVAQVRRNEKQQRKQQTRMYGKCRDVVGEVSHGVSMKGRSEVSRCLDVGECIRQT